LPESVLNTAYDGIQRFYDGERDYVLPFEEGCVNWQKGDGDGPRNNEFISLQKKELHDFAAYPVLGAVAARLTRSKTIRLLDDQLFYKPSATSAAPALGTGWHADAAYWATCSSNKLITTWIPFHDVPENRSPIAVMAGSHLWTGLQDFRYFNQQNFQEMEQRLRDEGKEVRVVPLTMKRGQASFHHGWTVHGSYPNTSGQPRLSYAAHYQDGENHYRAYKDAKGREVHIFDEKLCRKLPNGDPDFSDPAIFPTVWSEEG
jgi:ectoine hydroxylase-related dioxygenase (phytanoyl-CoA dioxygenase family)